MRLADPIGKGLASTGWTGDVVYFMNPALLWDHQGRLGAVIGHQPQDRRHDQCVGDPGRPSTSGQLAMMLVMVAYTLTGCTCSAWWQGPTTPVGLERERRTGDEPRPAAQCAARRPSRGPARRGGRDAQRLNCPQVSMTPSRRDLVPSVAPPPPVPVTRFMSPGPDAQNVDPLAPVTVSDRRQPAERRDGQRERQARRRG